MADPTATTFIMKLSKLSTLLKSGFLLTIRSDHLCEKLVTPTCITKCVCDERRDTREVCYSLRSELNVSGCSKSAGIDQGTIYGVKPLVCKF